jgi:hypothetical protein
MKIVFFQLLYNAATGEPATGATNNDAAPAPLTSETLAKLQADYKTAWSEMIKISDPMSKEAKDAKLALWKIEGEIKNEEARLNKQRQDAILAEKRNERLALNSAQLEAHAALLALQADKKAKPDDVQAALDRFNAAKEVVDNELLAKYAASSSARKPKTDGDKTAASSNGNANTAAIVELYLQGKTHKEIEELGYKRSTVWHAINNYKKANAGS